MRGLVVFVVFCIAVCSADLPLYDYAISVSFTNSTAVNATVTPGFNCSKLDYNCWTWVCNQLQNWQYVVVKPGLGSSYINSAPATDNRTDCIICKTYMSDLVLVGQIVNQTSVYYVRCEFDTCSSFFELVFFLKSNPNAAVMQNLGCQASPTVSTPTPTPTVSKPATCTPNSAAVLRAGFSIATLLMFLI
jgi:hypothetical protein